MKIFFFKMSKLFLNRAKMLLLRRGMCVPASGNKPTPENTASPDHSMLRRYKPTNFQKTLLVWTKKYKSKEEIPPYVSPEVIDRARSEARIKISNILMVLTALASVGAILSGKAAAKKGESVHQMNLDWHKKYREEYEKKNEVAPTTN